MKDSARQLSAAHRALARTDRELRTEEMTKNTFAARRRLRALERETRTLRRELILTKREMRRERSLLKTSAWSLEPAERWRLKTLVRASKLESAACKRSISDARRILDVISARLRDWKPGTWEI
jgi:hypothetical protein